MVNQSIENVDLAQTQMVATLFNGMARHSPEGMTFERRAEEVGWKHAVADRDPGSCDWTDDDAIDPAD
jgi:enoyl-CoA hydratase